MARADNHDDGRRRAALAAAAVAGGVLTGSLIAYREWVDGPYVPFVAGALLAGAAALLAAGWGSARGAPPWLLPLLALAVSLPGPAVHVIRLANRQAALEARLEPLLGYRAVLEPALKGEATFRPGPDELALRVPAGSVGFFEVHLPAAQAGRTGRWELPRALLAGDHPRVREELTWRASVEREGAYFVLVEADRVLVQLTAWGLLVTTPDPRGEAVGHDVALPLRNGAWYDWGLRRGGGRLALLAGGREVWAAPDPGPFRVVRLGETRTDPDHGGTLRLSALRFARFLA